MTSFADWINIEPVPMSAFDHVQELEDLARARLASSIERRVKTTLDPGVDPKKAAELSTLKVTSEGKDFVIKTDDSMEALNFGEASVKEAPPPVNARSIDDLFTLSSGVPEVVDGKLVYKTVSMDTLFGSQTKSIQEGQVQHIVKDVIQSELPDAYDEAFAEIERRHPSPK